MITEPKVVRRYQTTDGEVFERKMDAWAHEKQIVNRDRANVLLEEGKSIGFILKKLGIHNLDPILDKITKDSKFTIEHWQCSDKAGYKVKKFNQGLMAVYLFGDVQSWSGEYGQWLSLDCLARHAKHKNSIL